jgi:hypothetical protein
MILPAMTSQLELIVIAEKSDCRRVEKETLELNLSYTD